VFLGLVGMYFTGTLWTAPRNEQELALRLRASNGDTHDVDGARAVQQRRSGGSRAATVRTQRGDESNFSLILQVRVTPPRSLTVMFVNSNAQTQHVASWGNSSDHAVVEMTPAGAVANGHSSHHSLAAPQQQLDADRDASPEGGYSRGGRDIMAEESPGVSARCVAYAYGRVPFLGRRNADGGSEQHVGERGSSAAGRAFSHHGSRRLPYSYFFARPAYNRRTFFKHLLSHLAAVAAWTGLWDVLDQSLLPWLSQSCVLAPGFIAEYPCVFVKMAFITAGAAGLHWTGTLYYTLEEEEHVHSGHERSASPSGRRRRRGRSEGPSSSSWAAAAAHGSDDDGWEDTTEGQGEAGTTEALMPPEGRMFLRRGGAGSAGQGSATAVLLAKLRRRRLALGKAAGRITKRGRLLLSTAALQPDARRL